MWQFIFEHTPLLYFTQSLWRDEAYSVLLAERPVSFIVDKLSLEPPLPYITLHYWMQLFGTSEISVRGFMLLIFCLAVVIVIFWAEKIFEHHWLAWFLPIFFFINPMLIYYAFEVRSYSWYIFFSVLMLYGYTQKKWWLYTLGVIGGLYTHTYMLFTIAATVLHWIGTNYDNRKHWKLKNVIHDPLLRSVIISSICYLPWLIKIIVSLSHLGKTWYFPVDLQLVKSVVGNMFLGYEGTPWYGWKFTSGLSLVILGFFGVAVTNKKHRSLVALLLLVVFIPLITVIGISFYKPLYVNRYLIPVTIGEIFLIILAIDALRKPLFQILVAIGITVGILWFNTWYPDKHAKVDIRSTMRQIQMIKATGDPIYATHPLIFLETLYYAKDKQKVYLYNPKSAPFPWFVGDAVVEKSHMAKTYPTSPAKAYMVNTDGTFSIAYESAMPTTSTIVPDAKKL